MIQHRKNACTGIRPRPSKLLWVGCVLALGIALALWRIADQSPKLRDGPSAREPAPAVPAATSPTASRMISPEPGQTQMATRDDFFAKGWQQLSTAARGAERDALRLAFLEELATSDPQRAIAFALAETDEAGRIQLLLAIMRGWGTVAPEAALPWARSQSLLDRGLATSAVLQGTASDTTRARHFVISLSAAEPEHAEEYSRCLVAALSQRGQFNQAVAFAAAPPTNYLTDLLTDAYARWTQIDPRAAIASARSLDEEAKREEATSAVLSRWASNDPAAAADAALELESSSVRAVAISIALRVWADKNPAAARAWIGRFEPSPELDAGMTAVATNSTTLQHPESAMIWAESIVAPKLRIQVLATVLNRWATNDPAAARRYADSIPDVAPEHRAALYSAFSPSFDLIDMMVPTGTSSD